MSENVPPGAIAVICGHCGMKLFTKPTSIGRVGKCAGCGEMIEMVPLVNLPPVQIEPPPPPVIAKTPASAEPVLPPASSLSEWLAPPPSVPVVRISFAQTATPTPPAPAAPAQAPLREVIRDDSTILPVIEVSQAPPQPTKQVIPAAPSPVKTKFRPRPAAAPAVPSPSKGEGGRRPGEGERTTAPSPQPSPQRGEGVTNRPAAAAPASSTKPAAAKSAAAPKAKSSKAKAVPSPQRGEGVAGRPATAPQAPASAALTARTQVIAPSAATLALFGKGPAAAPASTKPSAAESFPTPQGPRRIWGQWRQATPSADSKEAAGAPAGRVSRLQLVVGGAAAGLVIVGIIILAVLKAPQAGADDAEADWSALDYTTVATARQENTGDTIVRVRVKFDLRFSSFGGLTAEDWEVRDSAHPNRQNFFVSYSAPDKTGRLGLVGFTVSGTWRPADISFRVRREKAWVSLDDIKCKD